MSSSPATGSFESWSDTLPHLIGVPAPTTAQGRSRLAEARPSRRISAGCAARSSRAASAAQADRAAIQPAAAGRTLHLHQSCRGTPGEEAAATGGARWFNTFQDVTAQRLAESKIRRLNRVYAVLSRINSLIIRVKDRDVLFQQACRIIVKSGQFSLAWIALVDRERTQLTPVAWYGPAQGFVALVRGRLSLLEPAKKQSLTARAATKKPALVCNDVRTDARIRFKREHQQFETRSVGAFPLIVEDVAIGVLVLHATEAGFFDSGEMRLLLEARGRNSVRRSITSAR